MEYRDSEKRGRYPLPISLIFSLETPVFRFVPECQREHARLFSMLQFASVCRRRKSRMAKVS